MVALTIEVCSRKKGKVSRPSKLKMILLGYYIICPERSGAMRLFWNERLQHGEQMNRNFGIKSFYPKIRGHVFTLKFGKNMRTQSFQDCVIKESIR